MYEDRFTRAGGIFAGVTFVLAYCILLFDPIARAQMWPWVISTGACVGVLVWDERRLPPERLALAFPASRTMHVLAFGPIAVIVHFLRTRWPLGIGRAIVAGIAGGLVVTLPEVIVSAIGSPAETLEDLPLTIGALIVVPIMLAILGLVLERLLGLFGFERAINGLANGLLALGLVIVFGSAVGIGIALHR